MNIFTMQFKNRKRIYEVFKSKFYGVLKVKLWILVSTLTLSIIFTSKCISITLKALAAYLKSQFINSPFLPRIKRSKTHGSSTKHIIQVIIIKIMMSSWWKAREDASKHNRESMFTNFFFSSIFFFAFYSSQNPTRVNSGSNDCWLKVEDRIMVITGCKFFFSFFR